MRLPVIAIVGRPNVGKSTLFNRLARRRISIVEDMPGVTRDRLYAETVWDDVRYTIIDTGGFEPRPDDKLFVAVKEQTRLAIEEADVIVFLVDARAGGTPADAEVAKMLRRSGAPVLLAANKSDGPKQEHMAGEFYELGVDSVFPVSAEHGLGIEDLMDAVFESLPGELLDAGREAEEERQREQDERLGAAALDRALDKAEEELLNDPDLDEDAELEEGADDDEEGEDGDVIRPDEPKPIEVVLPEVIRLAVIGKPNAGKSSLVNKLLGEERHLVSDMPGTTVDAVDSFLEHGGMRYRLIDTAGIRRKRSISLQMEKYAVVSALKGMDRADVAFFLIDATLGLTEQDLKVSGFAEEKGKGLIICVNKWDLAKQNELDAKKFEQDLRDRMPHLSFAPVRFISALTGRKVFDLLDVANRVAESCYTRVPTSQVNRVLEAALNAHQLPMYKNKRVKIYYGAQVAVGPPAFVIATNAPKGVHFSYRRYLKNRFRDAFGFEGAPIRLFFRLRGDEQGRMKNIEARKRRLALSGKKRGNRGAQRKKKRH
jgi:GTP-binding protein